MIYRFGAAEGFWKKFYRLSPEQKESVRKAWAIFKATRSIRDLAHIESPSFPIYTKDDLFVVIEADLRSIFYIEGDMVWTVDIGTHDVYK